jgi:hypothetical protein
MKNSYNKRQKTDTDKCNKHVMWGPVTVHKVPVVTSKITLRDEIKALSLKEINQIIQLDSEISKRFLSKNGLMAILEIANDASQTIENYDSSSFRNIIYKYTQKNNDINDIFVGFRIYLITKKHTNITEQVLDDFESVMSTCAMIHESHTDSERPSDSSNEPTNQHCSLPNAIVREPDNNLCQTQTKPVVANVEKNDENSIYNPTIQTLYFWLGQLPKWLQDQILNSTPIQIIIAETKKIAEILDSKHIQNQIEKIFVAESSNKSEDFTEDKQAQRVTFIDSSPQDLVDTDMVLEDSSVRGLILPTVAVESNGIFNDNHFSGLLNFNGLNGFEVF